MLLSKHQLIFIHPPKTGGNSVQKVLLSASDDEFILSEHRDGVDRFEIRGPVTPEKHATVAQYAAVLGREFETFRITISVRHPFDRALSYYFSPHRWFVKAKHGKYELKSPYWSEDEFTSVANEMPTMCDFLRLDGTLINPDYIIRMETLSQDFSKFVLDSGLKICIAAPRHINRSADPRQKNEIAKSKRLRSLIAERFAEDFEFFEYRD